MKKSVRMLLAALGMACVALGAVGIVVPFLPSTPFFLLALFLFARSSERLHDWLVNSKFYKNNLQSFVERRAMTVKAKLSVIIPVTVVMGVGFWFMGGVPAARVVLAVVWAAHIFYFGFKVRTVVDKER